MDFKAEVKEKRDGTARAFRRFFEYKRVTRRPFIQFTFDLHKYGFKEEEIIDLGIQLSKIHPHFIETSPENLEKMVRFNVNQVFNQMRRAGVLAH